MCDVFTVGGGGLELPVKMFKVNLQKRNAFFPPKTVSIRGTIAVFEEKVFFRKVLIEMIDVSSNV